MLINEAHHVALIARQLQCNSYNLIVCHGHMGYKRHSGVFSSRAEAGGDALTTRVEIIDKTEGAFGEY